MTNKNKAPVFGTSNRGIARVKKENERMFFQQNIPEKVELLPGERIKITPDLIQEMSDIVERGNFRYVACQMLGIPHFLFQGWIEDGKKQLRKFMEGRSETLPIRCQLLMALEVAEGNAHSRVLRDIVDSDNIVAKMWFLERRYNKLYNKNPKSVDDETGRELKLDASQILAERLKQILGE